MKVISINKESNIIKLKVNALSDLLYISRVLGANDILRSRSKRRFINDKGKGDMVTVVISIVIEKLNYDQLNGILRVTGKIIEAKPSDFIRLNSYHTINIKLGSIIEIKKQSIDEIDEQLIEEAVAESKRAKASVILIDDEQAAIYELSGSSIKLVREIRSRLSKRLSEKEHTEYLSRYFSSIVDYIIQSKSDTILIAGPGFMPEDLKEYIKNLSKDKAEAVSRKKLVFEYASTTERSGVLELIKSGRLTKIMEESMLSKEFSVLETLLNKISISQAFTGKDKVKDNIYNISTILVNDNLLSDSNIRDIIRDAMKDKKEIIIFNSRDDAGQQLAAFGGIAAY
ncbi:MAG: mRNA surveillance protein Pelota [Candidatus Micrarchaeota archaeon]|nr:MAG: mRNA surveillance protein Pelota [Candidatus Micrarchaeota archaeon]